MPKNRKRDFDEDNIYNNIDNVWREMCVPWQPNNKVYQSQIKSFDEASGLNISYPSRYTRLEFPLVSIIRTYSFKDVIFDFI